MTTTKSDAVQGRSIQVYVLAAPEDQAVCEDVIKHLKPIIRNSSTPVEVDSDFNIPSGADIEKHKKQLFEADIVLSLISVDFIDDDDIDNRNRKVIERFNNNQTVMIPILVRNCMWKATPFGKLPMFPKNLQPLTNKQYWNSQDDAVTEVVRDIYASINALTRIQSEKVQTPSVARAENIPDLKIPKEKSIDQIGPATSLNESAQIESEAVQQPVTLETDSAPAPQAVPGISTSQVTSQTTGPSSLVVDWRGKYYRTVIMKRAGAILLDHIILFIALTIILVPFAESSEEIFLSAYYTVLPILYFVIMPIMESSKWQATIGKRILKLQITNRDGERISFLRAFWRNIMRSLVLYSYMLSFGILLVVQYFRFGKIRKLFHDELSGTIIGERLPSSS